MDNCRILVEIFLVDGWLLVAATRTIRGVAGAVVEAQQLSVRRSGASMASKQTGRRILTSTGWAPGQGRRMDLTGKVAVVTGAASGMGEATSRRLAELGATVVGADVDDERGEKVFAELGAPHRYRHLDVGDLAEWTERLAEVESDLGGIDIVHLNAGVMLRPNGTPAFDDPMPWWTEQGYRRVMRVNVDGVSFGVIAALPVLERRGGGSVVVTASVAGITPLPIDPVYSMTKHAVVGLVRSLVGPLASRNVDINVICPGGVDTNIVPPDLREVAPHWSPPSFIADVVVQVLESGESGQIWVAMSDQPGGLTRYEFAPVDMMPAAG